MGMERYDFGIIGGGIVGLSTAMALTGRGCRSLVVVEMENALARHQSGRNSGVIHSGLYYTPGSEKAKNCTTGREELYRFCTEHGIPHRRCGKIVAALDESELPALARLQRTGEANGLVGLRMLSAEEVRQREPHVRAVGALLVPDTGVVDFAEVTRTFARIATERGARIRTGFDVRRVHQYRNQIVLASRQEEVACRFVINCGGLQADRVASMCGLDPDVRIIPFRGEFHEVRPARAHLVKHLIYPVPDPHMPFLGVHFTRGIDGRVLAGPNALLAFGRRSYRRRSISLRDSSEMLAFAGFWRMARKYWRTGASECYRALSKRALVRALRRMIPDLAVDDLRPAEAGIRAQAVGQDGRLIDDFRSVRAERMIHVLNASSRAATGSLALGRQFAVWAARAAVL